MGLAGDVLGTERRRLVAQSRPRELSVAVGPSASAQAGVPGRRRRAAAHPIAARGENPQRSVRLQADLLVSVPSTIRVSTTNNADPIKPARFSRRRQWFVPAL